MAIIDAISALKKRPRASLLTVASPLPQGVDWRKEITYVPEGCKAPDAEPVCRDEDTPLKAESTPQSAVVFKPFGVVATDGCNDPWAQNEEFLDRADRTLRMGESAIMTRELINSTVSENPDLQDEAINLTDLMADPVAVGWVEGATALLWNMQNAGYVGDVWLHAPSWLLPSFMHSHVGDMDPATRQAYIGPHPVIFDSGNEGLTGPGGPAGGAAPNEAGWVYATGPVEYAFAQPLEPLEAGNNAINDRYVVQERAGIIRFDPCQVFGILIGVCKNV